MAVTPQNNDAFFREVDDELRRERIGGFWQRYGKWLVIALVLGLAAFAAWLWWRHDQAQKAGVAGEQLSAALEDVAAGRAAEGTAALTRLAASNKPTYRAAAKLSLADLAQQKGDDVAAAAGFRAVAENATLGQPFRDLALVRQIAVEFDRLPPAQVIARLKPLAVPGNPWFGSAGELTAAAHLKMNRRDLAGRLFAAIAKDKTAPESLRSRATQMAGVLGVDAVDESAAGATGETNP